MSLRRRSYWEKSGLTFLSFFVMAAILPVLLMGALNPESLKTIIRADQPENLRIWFEPAEIVTHPGVKFKIKVIGEYDSKNNLIPKVEVKIKNDPELIMNSQTVLYEVPFSGKVVLGTYDVSVKSIGNFSMEIPSTDVFTQMTNLNITTAKARIYSKP